MFGCVAVYFSILCALSLSVCVRAGRKNISVGLLSGREVLYVQEVLGKKKSFAQLSPSLQQFVRERRLLIKPSNTSVKRFASRQKDVPSVQETDSLPLRGATPFLEVERVAPLLDRQCTTDLPLLGTEDVTKSCEVIDALPREMSDEVFARPSKSSVKRFASRQKDVPSVQETDSLPLRGATPFLEVERVREVVSTTRIHTPKPLNVEDIEHYLDQCNASTPHPQKERDAHEEFGKVSERQIDIHCQSPLKALTAYTTAFFQDI